MGGFSYVKPLSNRLFNRKYLVTLIGDPSRRNPVAQYGNIVYDDGFPPSALRIEFDITKNSRDTPNKGTVSITNMAASSRKSLLPGLQCVLTAGYEDVYDTLFDAGVFFIKSEREGPDIITGMELLDGDGAIANIAYQQTWPKGTHVQAIFYELAAFLQIPNPAFTPSGIQTGAITFGTMDDRQLDDDYSVSGPVRNTLSDLCRDNGLEWSIQNNVLQICGIYEHLGDTGELISAKTGMIGVPSWDGSILTVKTLLNPRLQPGKMVRVLSKDLDVHTYKIRGGKWRGDSHGDDWTCELECIPIPEAAVDLQNQLGRSVKEVVKEVKKAQKWSGHIKVHIPGIREP